jgi:hypothetical protein
MAIISDCNTMRELYVAWAVVGDLDVRDREGVVGV